MADNVQKEISAEKRNLKIKKVLLSLLPFAGLVLLIIFFQIASEGKLLAAKNVENMFKQAFALLIAATAGVFVMSTGNLDFSIGANLGFCGTIACFAAFINPALALPAAIIAGVIVGIANGVAQVFFKLSSFVTCLCMMFILTALNQSLTGGTSKMIPISMMSADNSTVKIITIILYMAVMVMLFEYTKIGKQLKAMGISEEASYQSGVKTGSMRILAYIITGAAAGLGGYFTILRTGAAAPSVGQTITTDVIIAIVLGGMTIAGGATSKITAAVVGTATLTILSNGIILSGMGGDAQQLIKGIIFIVVVAVSTRRDKNSIIN
ncbi:MAG: ABC transporter permease [Oscillospiraceae bacterium]|jgi:ribose transport system permease protein